MAAKYFVSQTDEKHHFILRAGNGQLMLVSPQFECASDCKQAIEAIRASPPFPGRYQLHSVADGKCLFHVLDEEGRIVGTSQLYSSKMTRAAGMASVKLAAPVATTCMK